MPNVKNVPHKMNAQKFRESVRSPISARREPSPHGRTAKAVQKREHLSPYHVWQNYTIHGHCVVMHIIAETCMEQVFGAMDVRDFKFYQKCEIASVAIVQELATLMTIPRQSENFSRTLTKFCKLYVPWIQSFLDKMRSLNSGSSLMALVRIEHAQDHYGKFMQEYHPNNEGIYVDADPSRMPRVLDLDSPHVSIASAFAALRYVLENPSQRNWYTLPVLSPVSSRENSPSRFQTPRESSSPARGHSPRRTKSFWRRFGF